MWTGIFKSAFVVGLYGKYRLPRDMSCTPRLLSHRAVARECFGGSNHGVSPSKTRMHATAGLAIG